MTLPYSVLVIDDDENALIGLEEVLRAQGHDVTATASYEDARGLLAMRSFDLVVTDVRLRSFNGLHLVMKIRAESPDTGVIIMSGYEDALLELEARRYNAEFLRKPVKPVEFGDAIGRALRNVRRQRRWPRKQVTGGFRVMAAGVPAAVMDVCYGGLRLQLATSTALPKTFEVAVQGIGLNLEVQPVWSQVVDGGILCGAALATESSSAARTWRTIVDRLTA